MICSASQRSLARQQPWPVALPHLKCSQRIASPEMLPGRGLLPQLKCSPVARRSGGGDEAAEHGDA